MADAALQDPALDTDDFDYPTNVEDAGPSQKKVTVTIPADRIKTVKNRSIADAASEIRLPGFRAGKAPRHLVEKKFGKALNDQVQQELIRESYQSAMTKSELKVIGEPQFDKPESIKLPEEGDFEYSFTVELQPEFSMPDVSELTVRKPKITINDDHVQQALTNLRNQQGSLVPVERGVEEGDYLVADVTVKKGEEEIASQQDAQLVARSGRIAGVELPEFAKQVEGLKVGESRTVEQEVPAAHPNVNLAGQTLSIEVALKDIKALAPATIDGPFLESLGFENEQELLDALREQMEERVAADIAASVRKQVSDHIASKVEMTLPENLVKRQADRVVNRRAVNLLMRGLPRDRVEANIDKLKEGSEAEAERELKLFFMLSRVAEEKSLSVDEDEVNGEIAMQAINNGQRPEAVKRRMEKDGSIQNLYQQMLDNKALDSLAEAAKVEEFEPSAQEAKEVVDGTAAEADEADEVVEKVADEVASDEGKTEGKTDGSDESQDVT